MTASLQLAVAGRQLAASLHEATDPRACALVLHGWTGSRSGSSASAATALAGVGVTCLVPDLPGHGDSPGNPDELTRAEFLQVASACLDELAAHVTQGARDQVLLVGTSFGGYLAAQLVATHHVDALVLRVPADYPDDGFDEQPMGELFERLEDHILDWRAGGPLAGSTRPLRALAGTRIPMLVQRAELDQQVPKAQVDALVDAHPDPELVTYELLAGTPHALSHEPERLASANASLAAWADRLLS